MVKGLKVTHGMIYVRILNWTAADRAVACVLVDDCHKV